MGEKKDRGRFSIKFNENDPAHRTVIGILEQQGPRQKAQFIANAVLHYIHCPETPDVSAPSFQPLDRDVIEKIVLEILKQGEGLKKETKESQTVPERKNGKSTESVKNQQQSENDSQIMDDDVMALIASTMSAFRNE